MPIPSSINDLSPVAGSNFPAGSESPSLIDDYLRTYASYIAQLRDSAAANAGSLAGVKNVSVPYTVIASDANKLLVASGTGAVTIPASVIPISASLVVSAAAGTDAITVVPPGGGFFAYGGQQTPSINLSFNESVTLISTSSNTLLVASGGLRSSNDFSFLASANGWMRLANDFVLQWGLATTSASADIGVTLPIAFKTNHFTVNANIDSNTVGYSVSVNSLGLTSFAMSSYSSSSVRAAANTHWFAIGK